MEIVTNEKKHSHFLVSFTAVGTVKCVYYTLCQRQNYMCNQCVFLCFVFRFFCLLVCVSCLYSNSINHSFGFGISIFNIYL